MNNCRNCRCIFGVLILGICSTAPAVGQGLNYVDADDGFFSGTTNISPLSAFDLSGNDPPNRNDGLWHIRNAVGYQETSGASFIYEATGNVDAGAGDTGEDVPEVMQTISGLTPGQSYKLYAVYWTNGESWVIQTGTTSGSLTYYDAFGVKDGATAGVPTSAAFWSSPPTIGGAPAFVEGDRSSYLGYAGTVVADGSGQAQIFVDDFPGGGTSSAERTWWDGAAYIPAEFDISLAATIDRDSGEMTLANNTGTAIQFTDIAITSASQALNSADWTSITGNYDTGTVDTDPWEITAPLDSPIPTFTGTLSEMESAGAATVGASLANGQSISLGNIWQDTRFEDIEIQMTLTDATTISVVPTYTGNAHILGDFSNNGSVGLEDYAVFSANLHTDVSALGQAEAYLKGDMNGDLAINYADFVAFRDVFPGSLAAALAEVPEPSTGWLIAMALIVGGSLRQLNRIRFRPAFTFAPEMNSMNTLRPRHFLAMVAMCAILLANRAQAVDVTLDASDAFGTSSFNAAGNWSNGAAPNAGNDYFLGMNRLRTPPDGSSYTFGGDSLHVTPNITTAADGGLMYKGTGNTGVLTINSLFLDGGLIHHQNGNGDLLQLAGNITVTADSSIWAKQGSIDISAPISGMANLAIPQTDAPGETDQRFVNLLGTNSFTGNIDLSGKLRLQPTGTMSFDIGAAGVNNSVTGTGIAEFNGAFNFNLSGASTTLNDSWTIADVATQSFGSSFSVDGFADLGGLWADGTYLFDESTGVLTVAPAPPRLTLRVSTSGNVMIVNNDAGNTIDMNYYEIRSASGSLALGGWTSIDGDVLTTTTTWEKAGGSSSALISETNLLGMESFAPSDSVSIGSAFAGTLPEHQDLEFYYGTTGGNGQLFGGLVQYVSGETPGDFDGDGDVDGVDFLTWQRNPSVGNLADWQANFGAPLAASLSSVPEPTTLLLALATMAVALASRRREGDG